MRTLPPRASSAPPAAVTLFSDGDLLAAIAHEVANHLAAMRMHADLVEMGDAPVTASQAVQLATARAGALTGCISPLARPNPEPEQLHPLQILDRLQERIHTSYDPDFPMELASCTAARATLCCLEETVRCLVAVTMELGAQAKVGTVITLSTSATRDQTELCLSGNLRARPLLNPTHPGGGLALALYIAEAIAHRQGGWVRIDADVSGPYCVSLLLPSPADEASAGTGADTGTKTSA